MDKEFNKWLRIWDKTQSDWAKEEAPKRRENSFFTGTPIDCEYESIEPSNEEVEDWIDIYNRSLEQEEQIINEDGFGSLPNNPSTYMTNPTHFSSIGSDSGEPGKPVRVSKPEKVTDNYDKAFEKLNDAKVRLERLQRKSHRAEVLKERNKYKKELASLREMIHKLSQDLQSKPQEDVT